MSRPPAELTETLLRAARAAGADSADALVVSGASSSIDVRAGALEQAERSESIDMGLRVFIGNRQANVSASDTKDATIAEMAERAVAMARIAPEDPHAGLAAPGQLATDLDATPLDLVDATPEPEPAMLQGWAEAAEAAALATDGITQVQSASATHGSRTVHLATSTGFSGGYDSTGVSVSCVAISGSGTGMERDYDFDSRTHVADLRDPAEIGRRAAERAVARHGARRPATGSYPVVFDERVAGSLIGHLVQAINGTAVARGASWLLDGIGQQVLPAGLSLIEDPRRARVQGSRLFDAEGLPTRRRAIVDNGVLTGWTLDLATARKLGMASTGNAMRGVSAPPSPGVTHLALTQGARSRADCFPTWARGFW